MPTAQTDFLDVDGGTLYYEVTGDGDPLVLNHAGFVDSGMWDSQWDAFSQQYRVVRFDMRGYGRSSKLQAPVSRRQDLRRLLDHLGIERAHLLGCSMGGEIILDFTLEHPDRVMSLIPVSAFPTGFEMQGEPPPDMLAMIAALQQGDHDRVSDLQIRLWVDGMFRQPEQVDPAVRRHAAAMNRIPVANDTFKFDMETVDPLDPPAVSRLGDVHVPTLIIDGGLDHPEILRAGDLMVAQIPNARKVVIADTAHVPNMEKPAEFNRAVLEFLSALG